MSIGCRHCRAGSSFSDIPPEILLQIIPFIPFDRAVIQSLRLSTHKFKAVIDCHERSLVEDIRNIQFRSGSLYLFPGLAVQSYQALKTLHHRLETLDSLHTQWLRITNNSPELDWLSGRWEGVHKAGLLLLYRLQDAENHEDKIRLLQSLPTTSLACLFFKLISSIRILRIYGPDPIRGTFAAGDVLARSDIELAFEELLLQHGPAFFIAMLGAGVPVEKRSAWAVHRLLTTPSTLEAEIGGMIERQAPLPDGTSKPPTLISCLRRAFAAGLGCEVRDNTHRMWQVLSSTSFDLMDDVKLVQIVSGQVIASGMKRMGY